MSSKIRYGWLSAVLGISLVVLLPSVSMPAAWSLLTGRTINVGTDVSDLISADFDNDGIPDIICVNHKNSGSLTYLAGKGDATFERKLVHKLTHDPLAIDTADFDKDGSMDVVMTNWDDNTISVLLGRGDKTFDDPVDHATGLEPVDVETADLNNDGVTDIVVACLEGGTVDVFLGNGDGSFAPQAGVGAGALIRSLTAGNFVGDASMDIACTNWDDNTVTILEGNGTGGLAVSTALRTGNRPWTVEAADFNLDDMPDLVVTNTADDTVHVFLNSTTTAFDNFTSAASTPSFTLSTNSGPSAVKAALMNNDRYPDLLVAEALNNNLAVYLGRGDGNFDLYGTFYATIYPSSVVTGDFDGDLLTDDAVGAFTSGVISPNKGNLTIEGNWGFQPYTSVPPPSYPAGLTPAYLRTGDFNGDTRPDLIAADSGTGRSILPGDGFGTPGASSAYTAGVIHTPSCSPAVDLSNDFRPDFATAVFGTATTAGSVSVQLRQVDGTLGTPVEYPVGIDPTCVYTVDLNDDSFLDLVTTNAAGVGDPPVYTISVLINNQTGGFMPAVPHQLEGEPVSITIGNMGTDSFPDLVVSNLIAGGVDRVSVLNNTNGSGFTSIVNYDLGEAPGHVLIFDLNRDGKKDLAVPYADENNVVVMLSGTTDLLVPQTPLLTGPAPVYVIACDLDMNGLPDLAVANSGDSTISVILSEETSTLTVDVATSGVAGDTTGGSIDAVSGVYDTGTTFVITATPNPGYTFTGWSGDIKGAANPLPLTLNGDKSVTANFAVGPYITGVSPDNGIMGDAVTIDGINFGASGSLTLGGRAVKGAVWSDTSITFTVPTKVAFGTKNVNVMNRDLGTAGTTTFTVNRATITGISPANAVAGAPITITGTNFGPGTGKFKAAFYSTTGAKRGARVTSHSATTATLTVPRLAPGAYGVTVRNSHGESASFPFTVDAVP